MELECREIICSVCGGKICGNCNECHSRFCGESKNSCGNEYYNSDDSYVVEDDNDDEYY